MQIISRSEFRHSVLKATVLSFFILGHLLIPGVACAEEQIVPARTGIQALQPGETLTYDISWSRLVSAGTAVMEIKRETLPGGRPGLLFVITGHSLGAVDSIFPVQDTVKSTFDPQIMESLSYHLSTSHGKKKMRRDVVFDHQRKKIISTLNDDAPKIMDIPEQVQDALSSLYYLRTIDEFTVGKVITVNVFDGNKNWSIQVLTLGREKVKTPAGEFSAIKVKTHPLYEGVFLNKGEVFIWLTDDHRKVPVLMKSTITIGSFVFTLTEMTPGMIAGDGQGGAEHRAETMP
jgi:hypothetical protein